jgi:hypothetical protein
VKNRRVSARALTYEAIGVTDPAAFPAFIAAQRLFRRRYLEAVMQ